MKHLVTQTERRSNDFYLAHPSTIERSTFFQYNVFDGLADVELTEYMEKVKMTDTIQSYLTLPRFNAKPALVWMNILADSCLFIDGLDKYQAEAAKDVEECFSRPVKIIARERKASESAMMRLGLACSSDPRYGGRLFT